MMNKKGTALMQVLLITVIIATIATFIMRLSMSRSTTAARSARVLAAKALIEGCQAEIYSKLLAADLGGNAVVFPYTCYSAGDIKVTVTRGSDNGDGTMPLEYTISATDSLKL